MGFSIIYRSTEPVTAEKAEQVRQATEQLCLPYRWQGCEGVPFFDVEEPYLWGASKPNFHPQPEETIYLEESGLPIGTTKTMLDVLCTLSREHGIDWHLSHDHEPDMGMIRAGVCDEKVLTQIEAINALAEFETLPDDLRMEESE